MLDYNELYELLRKEKYSELLQILPKNFVEEFCDFLNKQRKEMNSEDGGILDGDVLQGKKQLENAIAIFKELILRRKKKILNLVFVASETGIMKKDYENMLGFEKDIFDKFVSAFEEGDKELNYLLNGKNGKNKKGDDNKMIIFNENVEEFVDMNGDSIGPFKSGTLVNLDKDIADILVSDGKATMVDEE